MDGRKGWQLLAGDQGVVYGNQAKTAGSVTCASKTTRTHWSVSMRTTDIHCIVSKFLMLNDMWKTLL